MLNYKYYNNFDIDDRLCNKENKNAKMYSTNIIQHNNSVRSSPKVVYSTDH